MCKENILFLYKGSRGKILFFSGPATKRGGRVKEIFIIQTIKYLVPILFLPKILWNNCISDFFLSFCLSLFVLYFTPMDSLSLFISRQISLTEKIKACGYCMLQIYFANFSNISCELCAHKVGGFSSIFGCRLCADVKSWIYTKTNFAQCVHMNVLWGGLCHATVCPKCSVLCSYTH